jgi:hypothetical protein
MLTVFNLNVIYGECHIKPFMLSVVMLSVVSPARVGSNPQSGAPLDPPLSHAPVLFGEIRLGWK